MSQHPTFILLATVIAFAFTACGKKAAEEEKKPADKDVGNIVTLTTDQLEHVALKSERVVRGNLETTLKTAGRVVENANKTAKVTSTLDGRLTRLNVDLNDRVKAGDVVGLV